MERLIELQPDVEIPIQFGVTVVATHDDAQKVLVHFQNAYPSDPRTFVGKTARQTDLATGVLEDLRALYVMLLLLLLLLLLV